LAFTQAKEKLTEPNDVQTSLDGMKMRILQRNSASRY